MEPSVAQHRIEPQLLRRSHISDSINSSSTLSASLSNTSQPSDTVAKSHSPRQSIYQRTYTRRQVDYHDPQPCEVSPTGTNSQVHRIHTSASIASFETRTSAHSEESSRQSSRSNLVCVRDFPTKDMPLPVWQLHFVDDGANSYEPLRDPDDYLYNSTLRRSHRAKALSWKSIKEVRVRSSHVVVPGADLVS